MSQTPPSTSIPLRILLCASAAHCAQVLRAAAATHLNLHALQPHTAWPRQVLHAPSTHPVIVLWALLPPSHGAQAAALEQQWRTHLLQGLPPHGTVHMLYGTPAQQAQQLAPWVPQPGTQPSTALHSADCAECLDASSEQKLFQHLLQPVAPPHSSP